MRLVVLASAKATVPSDAKDFWVLRLFGIQQAEEPSPPNLLQAVAAAGAEIRQDYPQWLWNWVSRNGLLELQIWPGPLSWWCYAPLSEKSPLRSEFLHHLYRLTLLRLVLEANEIEAVEWYGDDPALAKLAAAVAAVCGVPWVEHLASGKKRRSLGSALFRRCRYTINSMLKWVALRGLGFHRLKNQGLEPDVLLFSRFPILWERHDPYWQERMFGSWPDFLAEKGHCPAYVAIQFFSWSLILREGLRLLDRCQKQQILILEATLPFLALLQAHLTHRLFWRYFFWRRSRRQQPVIYAGLDIRELFWRELDDSLLSFELPQNRTIAAAISRLLQQWQSVRAIFLPFEYQPMERAVWAGAKLTRDIPVVGVQTGILTSNHMGSACILPAAELREKPQQALRVPMPDVLAAYGELPYHLFQRCLGEARVCLSGPVRYPYLSQVETVDLDAFCRAENLPRNATFVLVTSSTSPEESVPLLTGAFTLGSENPEIFLLFKFHYHYPLHGEVQRLARHCHCQPRVRIFETDLRVLLRLAPILISGGSSTGLEAIALGCMPLIFQSVGALPSNPMLEVPEASFFWNTLEELRAAFRSCLARDEAYEKRRAAWPTAIQAQLFRLDGLANQRLYQFLQEHQVFAYHEGDRGSAA
jgi:surface carbohydrate biosynthesis protein (TIGR04326 family)